MHVFLVLYFSASCIPTDESLLILLQPCVGCVVNLVKLMLYHDCLRLARTTYLVTIGFEYYSNSHIFVIKYEHLMSKIYRDTT
jgi:hypothetical protein